MKPTRQPTASDRADRAEEDSSAWHRRPGAWAAAGAAVSLLLALAAFDPYLFTGGDNARYYALAKALATGRGYVDLVEPGAPLHLRYPPGFPALLVPFYLVSNGSYVAMKALPWLAGGGLLAAVWLLGRRDPAVAGWAAAAAVWSVGLYHATQAYSHRLLSDLPFAALAALSLAVLQGTVDHGNDRDRVDRAWLGGCALAVGAFYVRVSGVTLLGAIPLWALLTRRWKRAGSSVAVFSAGLLPAVIPWLVRVRHAPADAGDYLRQFSLFDTLWGDGGPSWDRVVTRLQDIGIEYGTYQLPGMFWPTDTPPDAVRLVGTVLGGVLLAAGMVRALRSRGIAPWDLYVLVTLGLLFLWPWLGDRFMLTVVPFLWLYLLIGLDDASRRLTGGGGVAVAVVGVVAAFLLLAHLRQLPDQWERTRAWLAGDRLAGYDLFWKDYFLAASWIGENAPENAVVLARKPTLAWYWSGRPTTDWPFWAGSQEKWEYIRRRGVTHILIEPESARNLLEILTEHGGEMTMPFHRPGTEIAVFTLPPADPRGPESDAIEGDGGGSPAPPP